MNKPNRLDFATRCIHAGQAPDPTTGAVMMPIYATSTFVQQSPGVHKGYEYARTKNPTRMAFERCIADLEGGAQGYAFASGLAAIATMLECLEAARMSWRPTISMAARGGCSSACKRRTMGIDATYVDLTDRPKLRSRDPAEHQTDLDRDADQSAAQAHRSRRVAAIARKRGI